MFKDLRLKYSILLGYAVPLILTVAVSIAVYSKIKKVEEESKVAEAKHQIVEKFNLFALSAMEMQSASRGYILWKNEASLKDYEEGEKRFSALSESLGKLINDSKQIEYFRRIVEIGNQYKERSRRYITLVNQGKNVEAVDLFKKGVSVNLVLELDKLIAEFQARESEIKDGSLKKADEAMGDLVNVLVFGVLLAIIMAMVIGLWIAGRISRSIREAVNSAATTSTEIAATISQHEQTANQQAAMVNETTTTMEELAASSRQSAEQATVASEMAKNATSLAEDGNVTVRQSIEAMESLKKRIEEISGLILSLSEQTGQIGGIAELVKDLSTQINMLALNAAVEAARAGEYGQGFAVVAAEIRKLAVESKKSAEQTRTIVSGIQKATDTTIMKTEEGMKNIDNVAENAQKVRELFDELSQVAGQVFQNFQQVMLNSQQQSSAIGQVVEAANSINAGARETAAGISQTKIGIENLNRATDNLLRIV
jgi:methyl-accepting chemotaxis protein